MMEQEKLERRIELLEEKVAQLSNVIDTINIRIGAIYSTRRYIDNFNNLCEGRREY